MWQNNIGYIKIGEKNNKYAAGYNYKIFECKSCHVSNKTKTSKITKGWKISEHVKPDINLENNNFLNKSKNLVSNKRFLVW